MDIEPQWIVAGIIGLALLRLVSTWPRGKRAKLHRQWLELVDSILIALVLVFGVVQPFVVRAFFIPSESMEPTLMGSQAAGTGDRILVNRFIYELNPPVRGDIIVFRAPREALIASGAEDPTKPTDYVKRLIGLPGDRLQVRTGEGIYINGRLLKEPYILSPPDYDYPSADPQEWHVVPPDHYFVMGDNRNSSSDSHVWGDLPAENVLGKAMVIFWPVNRVHLL
jgi:signal peptidase I